MPYIDTSFIVFFVWTSVGCPLCLQPCAAFFFSEKNPVSFNLIIIDVISLYAQSMVVYLWGFFNYLWFLSFALDSEKNPGKSLISILSFSFVSGFIFIPNPFLPGCQRHWVKQCLKLYPEKPNVCNLDLHMAPEETTDLWGQSKEQLRYVHCHLLGSKLMEPDLTFEKV